MILVTVGTHEQPFNRLIKEMDRLIECGEVKEPVIIQTGFSDYEPKNCEWEHLYPYDQMQQYVKQARIVISHGGPSSFLNVLQEGKIPIVVPRQRHYGEHVNNHQVRFARIVRERYGNIIVIEEIADLAGVLKDYDRIVAQMQAGALNHHEEFMKQFVDLTGEVMRE